MDFCIDCGRLLVNNVCNSCKIIHGYAFKKKQHCLNCGHYDTVKPLTAMTKTRYRCEFCNYNYFYEKHYVDRSVEIHELLQSIERECPECGEQVRFNRTTGEMVCYACGLIYEGLIALD